jgi:AhpD family alkylhydroperoxidase
MVTKLSDNWHFLRAWSQVGETPNIASSIMQQRIDVTKVSPAAYQAVAALQTYVDQSSLDAKLRELIKIRASQINGCAFCLGMHTRDARKTGETDERMHLLAAWREAPIYSARERAALAWVEAITLVTQGHVPDEVFEAVRKQFSDKEIVDLTAAAAAINIWNRIAIALRVPPQVESRKEAA